MVYTGRGDRGETDLGSGESVGKDSERLEAYGTVDELNSLLGLIASKSDRKKDEIENIQNQLHVLQSELADMASEHKIEEEDVEQLEHRCDRYQDEMPPTRNFIIAGGTEASSLLHLARSVSRRAERRIAVLRNEKYISSEVLAYINRLSDLFFLMARHENHLENVEEKNPDY